MTSAAPRPRRPSSASGSSSGPYDGPSSPLFSEPPSWSSPPAPADASLLRPFFARQPKSLSGIALRSFCLGFVAAASLIGLVSILVLSNSPAWRLPFFLLALSLFHFLEFWTTAERNTLAAGVDSFLLTANWPSYFIAHLAAFTESFLVTVFFPHRAWAPSPLGATLLGLGLVLVLAGQAVRSLAMLQAGASFNHHVQMKKAADHALITTGLYALIRHPAYFGFFWWGLGTQLVLGNLLCFLAYALVLWHFFHHRILVEERKLVEFFGNDYLDYRARVGTMMPFIP